MNDKVREALEKIKSCYERNINHQTEKLADIPLLVNRALEALASYPWQPIETAPKDGQIIIVYRPNGDGFIPEVGLDRWNDELGGCWGKSNELKYPTLWQPLPKPPKKEG